MLRTPATHLPWGHFGPLRLWFPENSGLLVALREGFLRQEFVDSLLCNYPRSIVVRGIRVSTALTDKLGLTGPIVRESECAEWTFLRTALRWDCEGNWS